MGSLIAALASYLDARSNKGVWLVRIDDLDPPREVPGAAQSILQALQQHGLQWDESVVWQSERNSAYAEALAHLNRLGNTFNCNCTRAQLGHEGQCQSNCALSQGDIDSPFATRISVPEDFSSDFFDQIQGRQHTPLGEKASNFLVHRKDGLYAYQLAVVVDDAHQRITHTVRGSDLLETTSRQVFLQQALGYTTPDYSHLPVITHSTGQKLSKQNHAPALDSNTATTNIRAALKFLGQPSPSGHIIGVSEILSRATQAWSLHRIPNVMSVSMQ